MEASQAPRAILARLRGALEANAPQPSLLLVPRRRSAQWLTRLLIESGPLVGPTITSITGHCFAWAASTLGDPIARDGLTQMVAASLAAQPMLREASVHASYCALTLDLFTQVHRSCDARPVPKPQDPAAHHARDEALRAAFEGFRQLILAHGGWYAGTAPALVLASDHRPECMHWAFSPNTTPAWARDWLRTMGSRSLDAPTTVPSPVGGRESASVIVCDGPEVEVASVARSLRELPRHSAVLVHPREVGRMARRLADRQLPVRALFEHDASQTLAARTFGALHTVLSAERIDRRDLGRVLFGSLLAPLAPALAALPEDLRPGPDELDLVFRALRRATTTLPELPELLDRGAQRARAELEARTPEDADQAQVSQARSRIANAASVLQAAVGDLRGIETAGDLHDYLMRHGWGNELADAHLEARATREILEALGRVPDASFDVAARVVALALDNARLETWFDHASERSAGASGKQVPEAIWVLPYETLPPSLLPEAVHLANLDAHPPTARPSPLLSEPARAALGLETPTARRHETLAELDALAEKASCTASWRRRDGTGGATPPGAWILSRQAHSERRGLDTLAIARDLRPRSPAELGLLNPSEDLARRLQASAAQEADAPSPFTGELGVTVPPQRPYSASALARYADVPFRYFMERMLGVSEAEEVSDALDPLEQGTLVHLGLERTYLAALNRDGVVETDPPLLEVAKQHTRDAFAEQSDGLLAGAVWQGELDRWLAELEEWWKIHLAKLHRAGGAQVEPRFLNKLPDAALPGRQVIGVEVSLAGLELELGTKRIPFTGSIDRVERDPGRMRLNVVDYKTGFSIGDAALARDIRAGTHLQLPLYGLALQQRLMGQPEISGGITRVGALRLEFLKRGRRRFHATASIDPWQPVGLGADGQPLDTFSASGSFVLAFIERLERGSFPVCQRGQPRRYPRRDEEAMRRLSSATEGYGLPAPLHPLPPVLAPVLAPKQEHKK